MAVANLDAGNPVGDNLPASEVDPQVPMTLEESKLMESIGEDEDAESNVMVRQFRKLSRARQIQLIVSIAAAFSMMVAVFLWSTEPNYQLLYGKLTEEAAGQIIPILKQEGIPFSLDEETGSLKVPSADLHSTRILLAAQGLPKSDGNGFEMLDKSQGFGSSQFMEKIRYHRALEGELARSIAELDAVEFSRVHLAMPKQSVFVRDKKSPSAAVLVNLKQGRRLDEGQVSSIVHMVSSSIPEMKPEKVTVVDQTGKLLSKKELSGDMSMSTAQFEYRRKLENYYISRIERILIPIIGFESVRAQVDADIDFTVTEQTQESFNPDLPALRSEHTISEQTRGSDQGGVPGALTNQPPGVATAPETVEEANAQGRGPSRNSNQATFNYELDKTVSHSKQAPGMLRRISVAVVIDDKLHYDDDANVVRTPHAPEEIERITMLIKDSVGFVESRGDSINVINAPFKISQPIPEKANVPLWEKPWVIDLSKQAAGVILILLFITAAIRPVIRELTFKEEVEEEVIEEEVEEETLSAGKDDGGLSESQWEELGITHDEYEEMLQMLKELAADDPRIVAQIIKTWIILDEEM